MGYEQAAIKVEKVEEFGELKSAIERIFQPEKMERFLERVRAIGARVRDLEAILGAGAVEKLDESLAKAGKSGQGLYESLTLSDRAQMREFYLLKLEEVEPKLRAKFQKLYRYY